MGLKESKVTKNIPKDAMLWRYMTLDKLINILNTHKLFFTPINAYANTDPFEGLLPKVAMEAMKELYSLSALESLPNQINQFLSKEGVDNPRLLASQKKIKEMIANHSLIMDKIRYRIFKSTLVNCWHQNEFESEAMWRLYSENNKGVAIQTTVQDLSDSIEDERVFLSEVKYLNFYDENLMPKDCVVNGVIGPLLKRMSFEHEREVRLFFQPENDISNLSSDKYEYKSALISVDISKLISKIYISPYAKEPYVSSVREIIKRFELDESKVIHSNLLEVDSSLTKIY